ncbi:hypothetical protein EVJ58_g11167 [Rhodofomes roseus]|uniref:Uncharacterized protein n=1 Tax=Rhodofomes roseus TaxID=34475 RepID=A0A4Y9XLE2_9APHY|nr:hypothetical protein EVJ58_g11167 [Rhodofomes roseus]
MEKGARGEHEGKEAHLNLYRTSAALSTAPSALPGLRPTDLTAMYTSEYDYLFKLLLIGDSGVGKPATGDFCAPALAIDASLQCLGNKILLREQGWEWVTEGKYDEQGVEGLL